MTTFRAFDTQTDAKIFKRFLETTGYENVSLGIDPYGKLWRVYFTIKQ